MEIYEIHAFEGAMGSSHRLRPEYNCRTWYTGADTTYGWDGREKITPVNPNMPMVFWDVNNGSRSYSDLVIILPCGDIYEWAENTALVKTAPYYWRFEGETATLPIPHRVVELRNAILNGESLEPTKNCKYFVGSEYLHCAVHPSGQCLGCVDYEEIK
jgi:hypothetical protein